MTNNLEEIRIEQELIKLKREKEDYHHLELFKLGIKPGALVSMGKSRVKQFLGDTEYSVYTLKSGSLVTRKPINKQVLNNLNHYNIGILLGYPKLACEAYVENVDHNYMSFINFGGIVFNTTGVEEHCLNWCKEKYLNKMIEYYGKVECTMFHLIKGEVKNKVTYEYKKELLHTA